MNQNVKVATDPDHAHESLLERYVRDGSVDTRTNIFLNLERRSNVRLESKRDLRSETTPPPDFNVVTAQVNFEQNMTDYWAGLTWSHTLSSRVGIGVSTFVAVRSQRSPFQILVQAETTAGQGVALQDLSFSLTSIRLIWKAAIAAEFDRWSAGLSVTTPGLNLFGSGSVSYDETLVTSDLDGDGDAPSRVISDLQDLDAKYRSPLSIGLGAAYRLGSTRLHASAEWFDAIDSYSLLDADPVVKDTLVRDIDIAESLDAVINFGFGVEHQFSENTAGYASFRTDFSGTRGEEGARSASISIWDIYHLAAGSTFRVGPTDFTFGGILAFGSEPSRTELGEIPDGPETGSPVAGEFEFKFVRFTLVLGFSIAFD